MTESEQRLEILLRIRNIRANRQLAVLKASENIMNGKLNEQKSLTQKIEADRQAYSRQQREQTEKLLNNQSAITDFLILKAHEDTFIWNSKQMTRQGDALVSQIQQSRLNYEDERQKYKVVEKAVVKVEEFLKLNWA